MDERTFQAMLSKGVQHSASDILFKVGQPPAFRIHKELRYLQTEKLMPAVTREIAQHILKLTRFGSDLDALQQFDTAYALEHIGRFRVNVYRERGNLAIAMRRIPAHPPALETIGVPNAVRTLAELPRGLVLVVGAAGNGKSTTLAAMVNHINQLRRLHIITIEDPIEFIHTDALAAVSQREVGIDTASFASGLRGALRQDPDVILVGEIRDNETMDIALQAAETGHLVLSTLHTPDVSRTVGRVMALAQQGSSREGNAKAVDTRERFADSLQGIIAQRLLPKADKSGVILAAEILCVTGTARDVLKNPDIAMSLKDVMEQGTHPYGMQTFEMCTEDLVKRGLITPETARRALA